MNTRSKVALAAVALAWAGQAACQVTLYEDVNFGGRSYSTTRAVSDFTRIGFNDRASSVVVTRDRWEVCDDAGFGGRCIVLRPGRYASLGAMGMNDRVSSVRRLDTNQPVADERYSPAPAPAYEYGRRGNERLFEANVTDVHEVLATPEQRCWVERGQVSQQRGEANVPGAIAGALLGGVIGHQIGGGFGKDIATVGGVAAGAAVGANVGRDRDGQPVATQDVRRCADVPGQARVEYWDVTYSFRGRDHRLQMTHPPGPTVTVNRNGEPRG